VTLADLDTALLDLTDAQINAALVRRAQAKEQHRRDQAAARARKYRAVDNNAKHHAPVTPTVTQEKRDVQREHHAKHHAPVTPTVTQNKKIAPPVSPSPPSSPTGRENLARGSVQELTAYAVERGLLATDGEWLHDKMLTQGWKVDGRPVKDWQALVRVWQKNEYFPSQKGSISQPKNGTYLRTFTGGHGRQTIDRNAGTANAGTTSDYSRVGKIQVSEPVSNAQGPPASGHEVGSRDAPT